MTFSGVVGTEEGLRGLNGFGQHHRVFDLHVRRVRLARPGRQFGLDGLTARRRVRLRVSPHVHPSPTRRRRRENNWNSYECQ